MSDFPKQTKPFDRNAYRGSGDHNTMRNKSRQAYRPKQRGGSQHSRNPAEASTSSSGQQAPDADVPHVMTDAEVKQWFKEAEEEYEADKKAGRFDTYEPAGGVAPDFSKFKQEHNANEKPYKGLANSMFAAKVPEADDDQNQKE